jgi:hypothetical protein
MSNTPPSCPDEGKVKKKEGRRERRNKERIRREE